MTMTKRLQYYNNISTNMLTRHQCIRHWYLDERSIISRTHA